MVVGFGEIDPVGERLLVEPGEDKPAPGQAAVGAPGKPVPFPLQAAHRKPSPGQQVAMEGAAMVAEVVEAACSPGRLTGPLHRRDEQGNKGGDHSHYHKQFHERHAAPGAERALRASSHASRPTADAPSPVGRPCAQACRAGPHGRRVRADGSFSALRPTATAAVPAIPPSRSGKLPTPGRSSDLRTRRAACLLAGLHWPGA